MGVRGSLAAPLTTQEEQFAIPKEQLMPRPRPEGTRLFLPQTQQGQLHCPCRNTEFFPVQPQSGCWGLKKPLYQCCSVVLTWSEMKLFRERILLRKRQTRKGIMSFTYFLLNVLSKCLLGNSLSHLEAPACHGYPILLPVWLQWFQIPLKLMELDCRQKWVKYNNPLQNAENYRGKNYRSLLT